jgi:hypothetical protein
MDIVKNLYSDKSHLNLNFSFFDQALSFAIQNAMLRLVGRRMVSWLL